VVREEGDHLRLAVCDTGTGLEEKSAAASGFPISGNVYNSFLTAAAASSSKKTPPPA